MVNSVELDRRPRLDTLIELTGDTRWEYLGNPLAMAWLDELGLGMYREPGAYLKLWIGLKEPKMAEHCRWLFRTNYVHDTTGDTWLACEPEDDANLADGSVNLFNELSRLLGIGRDMNRMLRLRGNAEREEAWLLQFRQVVGISIATYISLMPKHPNWAALHDLLQHPQAWREANNAHGMPRDLLLRMHGFGPLMDHEQGRDLINLLSHDE